MKYLLGIIAIGTLAACGDGGGDAPDANLPPSVLAEINARAHWMDDFIWSATGWVPCTGCEHLVAYEASNDEVEVRVMERTPGDAGSLTERCTGTQTLVETEIDGVDPRERTVVHFTQAAADNDCGWGDTEADYVQAVVERDDQGNATLIASWVLPDGADPTAPFPGWDYDQMGVLADPMRYCATLPDEICEPSCDPSAGNCDLPEP